MIHTPKQCLTVGGIFGAMAVACGAFGAHILRDTLSPGQMQTFETAARYHLVHALAIVAAGIVFELWPSRAHLFAARGFALGTLLFSGSLYTIALGGPRFLGAITPLGGLCFIVGWLLLATGGQRQQQ